MARYTRANAPKKVRRNGRNYVLRGSTYYPESGSGDILAIALMLDYVNSSADSAEVVGGDVGYSAVSSVDVGGDADGAGAGDDSSE